MHPRSTPTRLPRWGPRPGCVAPRSNTPGILGRRALPSGRLARLGATPDFHHGLLASKITLAVNWGRAREAQSRYLFAGGSEARRPTRVTYRLNRYPTIDLTTQCSLVPVNPRPTPKFTSQSGERLRSAAPKMMWC